MRPAAVGVPTTPPCGGRETILEGLAFCASLQRQEQSYANQENDCYENHDIYLLLLTVNGAASQHCAMQHITALAVMQ